MGGETGEVFCLNGSFGENYLFTWDGLFIQSLFKDSRGGFTVPAQATRGALFDNSTAGDKSSGGNFVRTTDGKTYLVDGSTDAHVLEITGLDQMKRLSGAFTYTPDQFTAQPEMVQESAGTPAQKSYVIPKSPAPVVVDGKPDEWPELNDEKKPLIEIPGNSDTSLCRVAARYDNQNLYLAWRVLSPNTGMRNTGQDIQQLFRTGDAVDLMLGPEPPGKDGAGNLRLISTIVGGLPVAVLYEKKVPGTAKKDRISFSSPWCQLDFDRVSTPDDVKIAANPLPGGHGYFVEMAIPWSRLGITPTSGLKLKADFGILSADAGGMVTASRKYWNSPSTGLANDLPGEAELVPDRWGEVTLQ
jgi:hypothetical protein